MARAAGLLTAATSTSGARWALVTAAPAPFALIGWWHGHSALTAGADTIVLASITAAGLLAAAAWLPLRPTLAKLLAGLALLALLVSAGPALVASPALALLLAVVVVLSILLLQAKSRVRLVRLDEPEELLPVADRAVRSSGLTASILWLMTTFAGPLTADDLLGLVALGVTQALALLALGLWVGRRWRRHRVRALLIVASTLLLGAFVALDGVTLVSVVDACAVLVVVGLVVLTGLGRATGAGWLEPIIGHPARLLVATFALLCTVGSVLLALPRMSASGVSLPLGDASFTAVSAVCVTGLAVFEPGTALSPLGQLTLLLLIQLGGLGIMTFSTTAVRVLGRRMSLRHEGAMARLVSPEDRSQVFATTRDVLRYTLIVEAVGALILWLGFVNLGQEPAAALWDAVFTAVSAFCNAGFALSKGNFVPYQHAPLILHAVALLIVLGGLSPAVVAVVPRWLRRRPIPVQARLALITTLVVLVVGFLAYLALEWTRSLADMSLVDRLNNAWFQATSARTAGFNSVDLTHVASATALVLMALMLVGGSPGGTAGGFKTTTLAVLTLGLVTTVRGRGAVVVGGRQVTGRSFAKAVAVVLLFLGVAFAAVVALLVTQDLAPRVGAFETVSAVTTTGLSLGGTAGLDPVGRGIIMACMFIGRLGPLTLLMFMAQEKASEDPWRHPPVDIEVA